MQIRPKRILFNWVKCACVCACTCVCVCMCCLRLCVYKCVHGNVGHAHSRAPFALCLSLGQQARGQLQPHHTPPLPVHTSLSPPHIHTHTDTAEPSPESPKARLEVAPRTYIKHRLTIINMPYSVSKCTQLTNAINAISRYLIASHRTPWAVYTAPSHGIGTWIKVSVPFN